MAMVLSKAMNERLEVIVSGRVQMVMYRDFTCRMASRYSVVGEVQNLPDGTVKVTAEGEKVNLERLLKKLHKGPLLARVKTVVSEWRDGTNQYEKFSITYGK